MNKNSLSFYSVNYKLIGGGGQIKPYKIRVYSIFINKSIDGNI